MAVDHYENFPVASLLLPRRLVPAVETLYAFARSADDLADEGDAAPAARLAALDHYERELDAIAAGLPRTEPMFARLAAVVRQHALPMQPLRDLLSAFRQDVLVQRHADYPALLDYCRRSANPVGRLMLALYGAADDQRNLAQSDAICTALQLINFWQDVGIDYARGRIYVPQSDMDAFRVTEEDIARQEVDARWQALMSFQVARARALMHEGAPLALRLPGRIGWELRLVVHGGLRILEKIERDGYDVFRRRPTLGRGDWPVLVWRAARM